MWVPLMVFAFLFGLSMDYEVFILSRIREVTTPAGTPGARSPRGWAAPAGWSPARGDPDAGLPVHVHRPGN
jgi:hypothetical protein